MAKQWTQALCDLHQKNMDQKVKNAEEKAKQNSKGIEDTLINCQKQRKEEIEQIKGQITTLDKSSNTKLDAIDKVLRGNDKVGIKEQLRWLKFYIVGLAVLFVLMSGGRFMGITFKDVKNIFFKDETEIKKVESNVPHVIVKKEIKKENEIIEKEEE